MLNDQASAWHELNRRVELMYLFNALASKCLFIQHMASNASLRNTMAQKYERECDSANYCAR